jgi:hypothetical protein
VLTNILKNAAEAIEGARPQPARRCRRARFPCLRDDGATVRIIVEDNGKGLPIEGRERLTEPYMTTRSKGTGLGPRDRQEDHGGPWRHLRWRTARVAGPHQSGIPSRREGNRVGARKRRRTMTR